MKVEDTAALRDRDPQRMLDLISRFPRMCEEAWGLIATAPIPPMRPDAVVALGMGGSGIGGDLLRAYLFDEARLPVAAVKEYRLPAFVGPSTLVFACSYSGNTEETLSAYEEAAARGAACVVVTSGGDLLERARRRGHPAVVIPAGIPPRAALPYLVLPLLALLARAGVLRPLEDELAEAVSVLRQIVAAESPEPPHGEAWRLATAMRGRIPVIYSATPFLEPVAQRWKDQINENAKAFAVWNTFPELNHNETVGWGLDEDLARSLHVIILRDSREPDRLAQRVSITRELAFARAAGVDEVRARGEGKLARLLSVILVGDFVSWYLAVLRGVDPTPVAVIDELKRRLSETK